MSRRAQLAAVILVSLLPLVNCDSDSPTVNPPDTPCPTLTYDPSTREVTGFVDTPFLYSAVPDSLGQGALTYDLFGGTLPPGLTLGTSGSTLR